GGGDPGSLELAVRRHDMRIPVLWEITIQTELSETVTPTTVTQVCISKDKADHPEPPKSKSKDDCQVTGGLTGNFSEVLGEMQPCAYRIRRRVHVRRRPL